MAVKVKKLRGSYYIVIDHKGQRKTKKVGGTLEFARGVARQIEAKLTLGDCGILANDKSASPLFADYAARWLEKHVEINTKPATFTLYSWIMGSHLVPQFGKQRVDAVTAEHVEDFVYKLATKKENGQCVHAQKTISLIIGTLRSFFSYAKKHKIIASNPASCLGKIAKSDKPEREVESMTIRESQLFLEAVSELFPERYPFFFTAIRTGMRRGELIGLKWGDCSFGEDADDPNRYFMVARQFSVHGFDTPKTKRSRRRVDMSKQLRAVLLELRDEKLMAAMQLGKDSISDELIFSREDGEPLTPRTIGIRFMEPACQRAGIRRFTPHCLRHTFAVQMIQGGASLQYVSEQLGHSSITITADIYGKLQPGVNVAQMDVLDVAQTNANRTQTQPDSSFDGKSEVIDIAQFRGRINGSDALIAYYKNLTETKAVVGYEWDKQGHLRPNTQTTRKRERGF